MPITRRVIALFCSRILQQRFSAGGNLSATVTANSSGIFLGILAVTDNGTPNLTSYRRIILNVTQ